MEKEIVKRKKYEKKAQKVVYHLAEQTVNEETLTSACKYIEPYHYEEIVEERFLAKLCGYPLCSKQLINIPKQKYQISMMSNKVYDITDRKRYCSNMCYKSSKYLENQIPKQPVWTRENVQLGSIKILNRETSSPKTFEMLSNATEVISKSMLNSKTIEKELSEIENEFDKKLKIVEKDKELKENLSRLTEASVFKKAIVNEKEEDYRDEFKRALNEQQQNQEIKMSQIEEDNSRTDLNFDNLNKIFYKESTIYNTNTQNLIFLEYIIKRLLDLVTDNTRNLLKGDDKFVQNLQRTYVSDNIDEKSNLIFKNASFMMDTLDRDDKSLNKKPMPSFEQLREQTKTQELKVKAFYTGKFEVNQEECDAEDKDIILPVIDSKSQRKIREKIFSDKLIKNIENVLKFSNFIFAQADAYFKQFYRHFLATLNLTNENVVFRSNEWSLVTLIMFHLMSLKYQKLKDTLDADQFLPKLLDAFNLNLDLFNCIINFIINA